MKYCILCPRSDFLTKMVKSTSRGLLCTRFLISWSSGCPMDATLSERKDTGQSSSSSNERSVAVSIVSRSSSILRISG